MTPERWRRVNAVFSRALELSPDERELFVNAAVEDDPGLAEYVRSLLRVDPSVATPIGNDTVVADENLQASGQTDDSRNQRQRIGPYRIERMIGQGGMGVVYLARRDDDQYDQRVAIKIGARKLVDPMTQARLKSERQILANLSHPHIARLLDGGTTTDGHSYLVMEFVDGVRIDTYCEVHHLSVEQKLQLISTLCGAVHYAHQNLVIHRDIKAANILVGDDGVPKLLDFGIAKLMDDDGRLGDGLTQTGMVMMTPENAAPEQVLQTPITTATDTYALGLLMYRLLTGVPAFATDDLTPLEFATRICSDEPVLPSQAVLDSPEQSTASTSRQLRGDIDNIVCQALRKEPTRRYRSSLQLADDIERHLNNLPIVARTDSPLYRLQKFTRRHFFGMSVTAAAVTLLIGFAVTLFLQNEKIATERDHAVAVSAFLEDIFTAPDPENARGLEITAEEILAAGATRITEDIAIQPAVQSALMETIGRVYFNLGEYTPSIDMLQRSLALREELLGADHVDVIRARSTLAEALIRTADYARAHTLLERSLEQNRELHGQSSPAAAKNLHSLAELDLATGELDKAQMYALESIDIYSPLREEFGIELAESKNTLARILQIRGQLDETETLIRESIDIVESAGGPDHPLLAYYLQNLGVLLRSKGDLEGAEQTLTEALDATRRILGEEHDLVATTLSIQGGLLHQRGELVAAEAAYREALAIDIARRGETHPFVGYDLTSLAMLLHDAGRLTEAEASLRQALEIYALSLDGNHQYIASALTELGAVLTSQQRAAAAVPLLERALRIRRLDYADDNVLTAATMAELGNSLLTIGDIEQAGTYILPAHAVLAELEDRRARRAKNAFQQYSAL